MGQAIRVMVIDDHQPYRESVVAFLSMYEAFEVLEDVDSVEAALPLVAANQPDLLLLDVHLAGMSGIEGVRHFHEESPDTLIVLCSTDPRERLQPFADNSHVMFVPKADLDPGRLIDAVTALASSR